MPLLTLSKRVKSGDPENLEAQGAKKYWSLHFGEAFRRDRDAAGVNALLNYGYTVFRAATARAVVAAGLHPSIGLHHSNDSNAMRLVDDLIEPFRPLVDFQVYQLAKQNETSVTPETKRALVRALYADIPSSDGVSPVCVCMQRLATSLAQVFTAKRESLDLPLAPLALSVAASARQD
jgi:CRISP-associated protein Cas1